MKKIDEILFSVFKLAMELETKPKRYGTDVLITGAEIHLLEIIGNIDDSSVTNIAKRAEVTKGAVSQKMQKLEKKGLIYKETAPDNLSKFSIKLTSKGQTAFFAHKHWHETMDGGFSEYYDSLSKNDSEIIYKFLTKIEDFYERLLLIED